MEGYDVWRLSSVISLHDKGSGLASVSQPIISNSINSWPWTGSERRVIVHAPVSKIDVEALRVIQYLEEQVFIIRSCRREKPFVCQS